MLLLHKQTPIHLPSAALCYTVRYFWCLTCTARTSCAFVHDAFWSACTFTLRMVANHMMSAVGHWEGWCLHTAKKTKPSQRGWRGPGLIGHEGEENCSQGSMPWHSKRAKNCLASPADVAFWQENSVVIPTLLQLHVPVVAQDHGPHTAACAFLKISQQLSWQKLPVQYMGEALPRAP